MAGAQAPNRGIRRTRCTGTSDGKGSRPQADQSSYGGQPQHYPQQQSQQQYGDWGTDGQQAAYGQAQQQYPDQQYPQQYQQQPQHQQYPQQYGEQAQQQQYVDQGQQQYANGGWDTGQQAQVPYVADPTDPYAQQAAAYGGEQPDYYGTPDAYPPPEPPARRRAEPDGARAGAGTADRLGPRPRPGRARLLRGR